MASRQLASIFEQYKKSQREFVQQMAEMASRPENIPLMLDGGALPELRPLLLDRTSAIRQTAALALGRLANYRESIAEDIVGQGILPDVVNGLGSKDDSYRRNACFVVRAIARHNPALAQHCVDVQGSLDSLVKCLESFDNKVRESAAWALGSIAFHNEQLAQLVVDANAIQFLIRAVQDPELSLRRVAVAALGDIARHTQELAQSCIDAHAITNVAALLSSSDAKLKQHAASTLAQIAKHSVDSAELVVEGDVFPTALHLLKDADQSVRKSSAALVREIVKHTQELAQGVVNQGGAAALVEFLKPEARNDPLEGLMAIGYIASFSQNLAMSLFHEEVASVVSRVFCSAKQSHVKAAAAWAMGQLGKHSPEHASYLTQKNVLSVLLDAHEDKGASEDLKLKSKRALKLIIEKTSEIEALQPLISRAPEKILKYVLEQISKLLPKNSKARVPFVRSGAFKAVQELTAEPGSKIRDYIDAINSCFPEQAVRFYQPSYPAALIQEIENYES